MANAYFTPRAGHSIHFGITRLIESEFKRRDMFPMFRTETAIRKSGIYLFFSASIDLLEDMLKDAKSQYKSVEINGSMRVSYRGHIRNLDRLISYEKRRGLIGDPGYDGALAAELASNSQIKIGDICIVHKPLSSWDGERVEIIGEYKFRSVSCSDGQYVDDEGKRRSYRWGYTARAIDLEDKTGYFFAPHDLRDINYQVTHIRLVECSSIAA
jgi:hypothetical protein